MSFGAGVEGAALSFLREYGYVALFVLMALETAMLLHFVPSEAIVPFAAAFLATSPGSLVLVIVVSTLGATLGSVLLYGFARGGGRGFLERHARFFGLTVARRDRLDRLFQRPAGESTVFFFRLLPFLRAVISIPAGLARMRLRKFAAYSMAGALVFNSALAYSTYAARTNPSFLAQMQEVTAYSRTRWPFFALLVLILALLSVLAYRRREDYRREPHRAVRHVLHASGILAILVGIVLFAFSLVAPEATYRAVTWIAVDAGEAAQQVGLAPTLLLLGFAFGALSLGLALLTVRPALEALTRSLTTAGRDGSGGEQQLVARSQAQWRSLVRRLFSRMRGRTLAIVAIIAIIAGATGFVAVWAGGNDQGQRLVVAPGKDSYLLLTPDTLGPSRPAVGESLLDVATWVPQGGFPFVEREEFHRNLVQLGPGSSLDVNGGTFRSPPADRLRVAFVGDTGTSEHTARILAQVAAQAPDLVVHAGDISYADADEAKWDAWFGLVRANLPTTPFAYVTGNHDIQDPIGTAEMRILRADNAYYSFDVGPVHFVFLDGNHVDASQASWLRDDLARAGQAGAMWIVPVEHQPWYSSGSRHGGDEQARSLFASQFSTHHVRLAVAGHEHNYERTNPIDNVTYIVTGGGGRSLYDDLTAPQSWSASRAAEYNFLLVDFTATNAKVRAIGEDGATLDSAMLSR